MPDSRNPRCMPLMPVAVSAPTSPSSLKVSVVFCSCSMTNLLPSATIFIPPAMALPAKGMDLAMSPSAPATESISGLSAVNLVLPLANSPANLPKLLPRVPRPSSAPISTFTFFCAPTLDPASFSRPALKVAPECFC